MKNRKMVTEAIQNIDIFDLLDRKSISQVVEQLLEMQHDLGDIKFDVSYVGYDGGVEIVALRDRLENDKEYSIRIASEEKEKARKQKLADAKKEADRKLYEKLKKQFGDE